MSALMTILALVTGSVQPEREVIHTVSGNLGPGKSTRIKYQAPESAEYWISGGCDGDCVDLDLEVWRATFVETEWQDADFAPDYVPVVSASAEEGEFLIVEVSMIECDAAYCSWNLEVSVELG